MNSKLFGGIFAAVVVGSSTVSAEPLYLGLTASIPEAVCSISNSATGTSAVALDASGDNLATQDTTTVGTLAIDCSYLGLSKDISIGSTSGGLVNQSDDHADLVNYIVTLSPNSGTDAQFDAADQDDDLKSVLLNNSTSALLTVQPILDTTAADYVRPAAGSYADTITISIDASS